MLRTIFAGLRNSFNFDQSIIERVICDDEVDKEILQLFLKLVLLVCCQKICPLSFLRLRLLVTR